MPPGLSGSAATASGANGFTGPAPPVFAFGANGQPKPKSAKPPRRRDRRRDGGGGLRDRSRKDAARNRAGAAGAVKKVNKDPVWPDEPAPVEVAPRPQNQLAANAE